MEQKITYRKKPGNTIEVTIEFGNTIEGKQKMKKKYIPGQKTQTKPKTNQQKGEKTMKSSAFKTVLAGVLTALTVIVFSASSKATVTEHSTVMYDSSGSTDTTQGGTDQGGVIFPGMGH